MAKLIPSMIIIKTSLRRHKQIARILPLKTHQYTTTTIKMGKNFSLKHFSTTNQASYDVSNLDLERPNFNISNE